MKTIALATYREFPQLIPEDRLLVPLLKELGIEAVPLDWETSLPTGIDSVVLRSCWNSHLKPREFLEWVETLKVPIWNPASVVRWNQDKTHLLDLQAKGIPLPRTQVLAAGSVASRANLIMASGFDEVVIKPTISASAWGTFRLRSDDSAAISAALAVIPDSSPLLLQEFIPAILTEGELSFIFYNGVASHALRKRPKAGDFRVQEEFGGSRELFIPPHSLIQEAQEILSTAGGSDWLYARIDIVPFRGRLFLMELEAIDPMFYFAWADGARERFARAIAERV